MILHSGAIRSPGAHSSVAGLLSRPLSEVLRMKRLVFAAAVLLLVAACGTSSEEAVPADTAAPMPMMDSATAMDSTQKG